MSSIIMGMCKENGHLLIKCELVIINSQPTCFI